MLLQESFDDPSVPLFGARSRVPGKFDFTYVGGFLYARQLAESGAAIVLLPCTVDHDHATIAVSARLDGEVAGRFLVLGCRRQDAETQTGGVGVCPGQGAPAEAYFDNLEVTRC